MEREKAAAKAQAVLSGEKPAYRNIIGMTFALIPAGTFTMGSPPNEPGRYEDETRHQVTISRPFYMQTTEVTQGQWKAVMEINPSSFRSCGNDCPVEQVSWNDAQEFIRRLNQRKGTDKHCLPTEAEWEYACRAGTTTPFNTGNCLSRDQANYCGDSPLTGCQRGNFSVETVCVASYSPNAWGLYDMHGNVWEWCQDFYEARASGDAIDPVGPSKGSQRVLRGGGYFDSARRNRAATRGKASPIFKASPVGFRLAMTP